MIKVKIIYFNQFFDKFNNLFDLHKIMYSYNNEQADIPHTILPERYPK